MDRGKYLFLVSCTSISSGSTVGLLLHLQYYQGCKPKMWVKSKFVLWQSRYNLLTENRVRKFTFLKHSLFWKRAVTFNFDKFFSDTIFWWYACGKFYMVRFNYFSGRTSKVEKSFWKIFWLTITWVILEIKILLLLGSVLPSYTMWVSPLYL